VLLGFAGFSGSTVEGGCWQLQQEQQVPDGLDKGGWAVQQQLQEEGAAAEEGDSSSNSIFPAPRFAHAAASLVAAESQHEVRPSNVVMGHCWCDTLLGEVLTNISSRWCSQLHHMQLPHINNQAPPVVLEHKEHWIVAAGLASILLIKEEVREDLYMQAGLQAPYCC
jgi:hypothetical protein